MFGEIVIRADMRYNYNYPGHWTHALTGTALTGAHKLTHIGKISLIHVIV